MMLLLHVAIAITSVGFSTLLYFSPSRGKLRASYALMAATIASGTYLIVVSHVAMLGTCMMGLLYAGVVSALIAAAHRKLAAQAQK